MVPGPGYKMVGTKVENNGIARKPEVISVEEMLDGRPVFSASVFGYNGFLTETKAGTVVWTEDCTPPKEILVAPLNPNQCGWGVCYPPYKGETYRREIFFYTSLNNCSVSRATYTATNVGEQVGERGKVTLLDTKVSLNAFVSVEWRSHGQAGVGEVFATSSRSSTTYTEQVYVGQAWQHAYRQAPALQRELPVVVGSGEVETNCEVIAFGDSLTEGIGATKHEAYPTVLQTLLRKQTPGVRVCNKGYAGGTTEVAIQALPEVLKMQPRIVILAFGANDSFRGIDREIIRRNLRIVIQELQDAGITVVLAGLSPPHGLEGIPEGVRTTAQIYQKIADEKGLTFYVPWLLEGVYPHAEYLSQDGVHPNGRGYRRIAETLLPTVRRALEH